MLSKCANPPCSASFRYFRQGKLFRVETEPSGMVPTAKASARSEFFWLCDDCASHLTLEYDRQTSVVIVKRLDPELRAASKPAVAVGKKDCIFRSGRTSGF